MEKKFSNSYGTELIVDDYGLSFSTHGVHIPYGDIERIYFVNGVSKSKILRVKYSGSKMRSFDVDDKDLEELRGMVAEIEQRIVARRGETAIKASISKYARAGIGLTLTTWVLVGVLLLLSCLNMISLVILLLLYGALQITYIYNNCIVIVSQDLKAFKIRNCVCQVVTFVICVAVSVGVLNYFSPGFKAGTHLDKECYWSDCDKPANGGVYRGGLYNPDKYFCKEHFEIEKNYASDQKGGSNGTKFTNKYGTATTKCAHTGCSEYIASSGDTNCCVTHSHNCLNCGCYIDEDAMYCMTCIEDALD